jgi:hypothetical protein
MTKEALQQALDALTDFDYDKRIKAIETIKNMKPCPSCGGDCGYTKKKGCQYQSGEREWIGLTDEEIEAIYMDTMNFKKMGRAIESKLKEKNT